jgi:glycine dehydrogenase
MHRDVFENRHHGRSNEDLSAMLTAVNASSVDELIDQTVPAQIRLSKPLTLPAPLTEIEMLAELKSIASMNESAKSYIGMGYYNTHTPPVILRNLIENPGWYTQYTPYQAEIAQGRLESLLNFQTMVTDLTKMDIAGASLLDEGTAAAEAMHLMYAARAAQVKSADTLFVDANVFPQTLDILITRATPLNIKVVVGDWKMRNILPETARYASIKTSATVPMQPVQWLP